MRAALITASLASKTGHSRKNTPYDGSSFTNAPADVGNWLVVTLAVLILGLSFYTVLQLRGYMRLPTVSSIGP